MGIQYKNTKNSKKQRIIRKYNTVRVFNKLDIDWLVAFYKAKCTVQWADEHIIKDVCRLDSSTHLNSLDSNWVWLD